MGIPCFRSSLRFELILIHIASAGGSHTSSVIRARLNFSLPRMSGTEILSSVSWILLLFWVSAARSQCSDGCPLAYGSYLVKEGDGVDNITKLFSPVTRASIVQSNGLPRADFINTGYKLRIPFSCDCINGSFLGHQFLYTVQAGDTYDKIAAYYSNLTSAAWLQAVNSIGATNIPFPGSLIVMINCSCGNAGISPDYGLFLTYPLQTGDNMSALISQYNVTAKLLQEYNPSSDFSLGSGLVFIPVKDLNGSYRPLHSSSKGLGMGPIAGASVAAVIVALLLAASVWITLAKRKKRRDQSLLSSDSGNGLANKSEHTAGSLSRSVEFGTIDGSVSWGPPGITVDKSVEFTYEELAMATNEFSMANKIGEGGFGAVFFAELRGEKAAVKRMEMEATREFLAELKVLTRVHHVNLVRLIGYCTDRALFLVYEYIDNGNLSQHLRDAGREPLPWHVRVQVALDSARGLEYIHEHTVPVYIHRDIKSANILIDKNLRGKVADFGLAKLTEVGGASLQTRLVGTFGYMPPEYARYGDVSTKVDVYAFGVVLYELISAKEAVIRTGASVTESKGLVAMFGNAFAVANPKDSLQKLVDPRLGDDYPLDSVYKMAQLANACTQDSSQDRPHMRSVVVALMALSSSSEDWDVGSFYENQALINLMAGR